MPNPATKTIANRMMVILVQELNPLCREVDDSIEAMDTSLEIIEQLKLIMSDRFMAHQTRVRRERNALLIINRLPDEILTLIFELAMDFDQDMDDVVTSCKTRAVLAAVSFSWCQRIDQTPAFWTTLSQSYPLQTIKIALEKSGNSPIKINASQHYGDEIWKIIAPHFDRCHRIDAFLCETLLELIRCGSAGLEDLDICAGGDGELLWTFPYPHGYHPLPRIQNLRLNEVSFHGTNLALPSLVSLTLKSVAELSFTGLLEMLRSSPSLIKLRLSYLYLQPRDQSEVEKSYKIPLAKLQDLDFNELGQDVSNDLLNALQPPILHQLRIMPDAPSFNDIPSYILESVGRIIADTGSLEVGLTQSSSRFSIISGYGHDPRCEIGGIEADGLEPWLDYLRKANNATPHRLILADSILSAQAATIAELLHPVVEVVLSGNSVSTFFNMICVPLSGGKWTLPDLSTITIHRLLKRTPEIETIPQLLEVRWASAGCALSSLTYRNYKSDPFMLSWLARVGAGNPGCKIYRKERNDMHEETDLVGFT